jgi:hypothetical protein
MAPQYDEGGERGFGHVWWGTGTLRAHLGSHWCRFAIRIGLRGGTGGKRAQHDELRVRRWRCGRWRTTTNADANAHPDTRAHAGGPADQRHLRQCTRIREAGPGGNAHCSDVARHGMHDRGRLQVWAFSGSGSRPENVRCGRQRVVDLDRRDAHHARSMADLRDVRIGQQPDLYQRHLAEPITSSSLASRRWMS